MNTIKNLVPASISLLVVGFLFVGCSDEVEEVNDGLVQRIVDSATLSVVENLAEARLVNDQEFAESSAEPEALGSRDQFVDIAVSDSTIWAVYNGGVIECDQNGENFNEYIIAERMRAVAILNGIVYVGGDRLYLVDNGSLLPVEEDFNGVVTALRVSGDNLVVGTSEGLYLRTPAKFVELARNINVSALAVDKGGIWIGTNGQGLYRCEGEDIRKRYLRRDSSLFDNVTALASWRSHLYLGTSDGLFMFNGGRWQEFGESDGLPSSEILSIEADGWVTYISTGKGTVSYFKDEFKPVKTLVDRSPLALRRVGKKLLIGSQFDGLLIKSGGTLKALVAPEQESRGSLVSSAL